MAAQEDRSDWLPKPPPPRPARRDEAINAALRRFDGDSQTAAAHERPRHSWVSTHRPHVAALASAMLLVVVGIPLAFYGADKAPPVVVAPTGSQPVAARESQLPADATPPAAPPVAGTTPATPQAVAPAVEKPVSSVAVAGNIEDLTQSVPAQKAAESPATVAAAPAPPPPPPPPPPPAPAVASNDAAAQESAGEIVLTGSRIAKPQVARPQGSDAKAARRSSAGEEPSLAPLNRAEAAFLSKLQSAVRRDDRRAVMGLIGFPLRVNEGGRSRSYRDAKSVERDFDRIFTAKVRSAISSQRADTLFARDVGGMIGNGEVWFDQSCLDSACSKLGPVRIIAVNP